MWCHNIKPHSSSLGNLALAWSQRLDLKDYALKYIHVSVTNTGCVKKGESEVRGKWCSHFVPMFYSLSSSCYVLLRHAFLYTYFGFQKKEWIYIYYCLSLFLGGFFFPPPLQLFLLLILRGGGRGRWGSRNKSSPPTFVAFVVGPKFVNFVLFGFLLNNNSQFVVTCNKYSVKV